VSSMTGIVPLRGLPGAALVIALAIAPGACTSAGATPAAAVGAPTTAAGPTATTSVAPTPRPTEVPGPPRASIAGGSAGIVQGELGAFTWDGLGSDGPWIVPPGSVPVAAGAPITVTLDPALAPGRWAARWAPVVAGSAGDPAATRSGTDAAVTVAAPVAPGTWGLQVEITFAEGRQAAWYWSIDVAP